MGEAGLERSAKSLGNPATPPQDSAESGALGAQNPASDGPANPATDPDLAAVMRAWPSLPVPVREAIARLAQLTGGAS